MLPAVAQICTHSFLPGFINSNSVVVDLGANHGEFAHTIIERYRCRVISVEPVKELYEEIARDPLLQLLPVAVGGKNETISMNVFSNRCATIFGSVAPEESVDDVRQVEMITLPELRKRTLADRIDLMKIDIEGAEIDLINGCSDAELQSIAQITVEFHDFLYPEQHSAVTRIRSRMGDIGFWVLPFSLDNTDVLFVNRKTGATFAEAAYLRSVVRYGKGIRRRLRKTLAR